MNTTPNDNELDHESQEDPDNEPEVWESRKPDRVGAVRGEVRTRGFRRISHGLFLTLVDGVEEWDEWLREMHAWGIVLPTDAVFTHLTGARLRGWKLPRLPDDIPVFAAVRGTKRPRRPGLICARLKHAAEYETRHGFLVDSAEEILLRCAQELGVLDLIILIDSAIKCGDLDAARMETLLGSKRPGVRRLREAYRLSNPKAQSAGESVLGLFHSVCDIRFEPQARLYDDAGNFVGQVDFLVLGTKFVHEYDGAHHRDAKQHRTDLRRDRALSGASYVRGGYTLDDLLNHSATVLQEMDRRLGRPHDKARLERWRRLVEHSMYTEATRSRMMNRWRRLTGVVEWSRTA